MKYCWLLLGLMAWLGYTEEDWQTLTFEQLAEPTTMDWAFNEDKSEITITIVTAMVDHWVGFGVSASGGMEYAEVISCQEKNCLQLLV